ncbi:wax ester/triacylglycerol synthase domain-containing protein [Paractinoplanes hotanensis]|uniref:diacylglycerol O-acyltransferase n=1 Tax=Paractinoplanes hotanensis TaxID=2906497 RepID=A0ABT0YFX2_9ACTN|nr:wax ester/triacylglycerol synthase domain-containing protein [Actinoplanes hotanensis]MCM4084408.1 WS/DGAT domain-containing protein [Actinoplanes hotanensis]
MNNADLAFLAMDRGPVPEQFAVVLVLGAGFDVAEGVRVLGERAGRIPRLRQRLVRTHGRAAWALDPVFDPARHFCELRCPLPGNERALLEAVMPEVTRRLRRDRPLWRAIFVTGLQEGGAALVLVVHHALVDGLGGLAVLREVFDDSGPAEDSTPRSGSHGGHGGWWCSLRETMSASGGLFPGRVAPSSLLRPTGRQRRAIAAHTELAPLLAAARRSGATVNAAVLVAVGESLRRLLAHRGEQVREIRAGVPVAGERTAAGNAVSPLLLTVPVTGSRENRMAQVTADTRAWRSKAAGPAPISLLGGFFRLLAATGGYRWYMNHQRRLHIVVSCLRGPARPVCFAGTPVRSMIPIVPGGASNLTLACQALSYAGVLTVTAVADPVGCPELDLFARDLQNELDLLARGS